jgi:tetratricopeptide (TPR) repeat protein
VSVPAINPRSRREKLIAAAQGYLEFDLPERALEALEAIADPDEAKFMVLALRGQALRMLERHDEALVVLEAASVINPKNIDTLLARAWCYKRTGLLSRAIEMMDEACRLSPKTGVLLYNLACYWALAGQKSQALSWLGRAIRLDRDLLGLIAEEHDFDTLRHDVDFQNLLKLAARPEVE